MSSINERWTDSELERYLDGDLDAERAAALSEALRGSASLRSQLDSVRQMDRALQDALRSEVAPPTHEVRRSMVAAAAVVLLAVVSVALWRGGDPVVPEAVGPAIVGGGVPAASEGGRVVEVFRISLGQSRVPRVAEAEVIRQAPSVTPEAALDVGQLRRSLAHGDVSGALELIEGAQGDERDRACRLIGQALASARTADLVLNGLSPRDQLEVCRAWAVDQRFLVETFDRLALLSKDESIRDEFENVIRQLGARESLQGWMRKSGLAVSTGPGEPVS